MPAVRWVVARLLLGVATVTPQTWQKNLDPLVVVPLGVLLTRLHAVLLRLLTVQNPVVLNRIHAVDLNRALHPDLRCVLNVHLVLTKALPVLSQLLPSEQNLLTAE
jgi:hypothetical protein